MYGATMRFMKLIILFPKYVKIRNGGTSLVSVMMAYRGIEVKLHLFQPSH